MITISKQQENKIPYYKNKWKKIARDTTECNRKEAERLIKIIYEQGNQTYPNVIKWYNHPLDLIKDNPNLYIDFCKGNKEELAMYDFYINEMKVKSCESLKPFIKLAYHVGYWIPTDECVLCCEKVNDRLDVADMIIRSALSTLKNNP